ncbi:MAG: ABC transporter ATP-binding protein [Planctomycetes bacterium]|nr:ABC transporter ATP-binding protein [Planctomycetota bacterium]
MENSAVEVSDVSFKYGDRIALSGVSFSVQGPAILGMLGPNGGGKSTLFKILATLNQPLTGSASVLGFDVVKERNSVRKVIGVVFQHPSLDKKLTIFENMKHQGHLYGLQGAKLRAKIEELLKSFELADRADDAVSTLSGGLARRVEIAKCMLTSPRVLLLDEPSTGLDPGARRDLSNQLSRLKNESGVTVLMTTHLLDEADGCDTLVVLDKGTVVARGTPRDLKSSIEGEIVRIECDNPANLRDQVLSELGVKTQVVDHSILVRSKEAEALALRIKERFDDRINLLSIGKPTLEDVFHEKTGRAWSID